MALTTDELFAELKAQIESHGVERLVFFMEDEDEVALDLVDVSYESGNIVVVLTEA